MTFYDSDGKPIHEGGLDAVKRIDYSRPIAGGPIDAGFDLFFGTACCPTTDWLYAFIEGDKIPVPPTKQLDRGPLPDHPYAKDNRPGMVAPDFDLQEVDLAFLKRSQDFLAEHVKTRPDQPFFLYHATQAVHLPSFPGDDFKGKTNSGPHGDFIFELDAIVGRLMDSLQQLGIADETIVIFSGDNGPEVGSVYHMRRDHQHDGARPWRGMKRDNWEGGHRVPLIVRWPNKVAAGSATEQIVSLTDIMATMADVVGVDLPDDAAEDSFSLLPVLLGKDSAPIRPYLLQQGFRGDQSLAIRQGPWKYLAHQGSGGNRYQSHRFLQQFMIPDSAPDAPGQLYNLAADPGETTNLHYDQPQKVRELTSLLRQSVRNGRSTPRR